LGEKPKEDIKRVPPWLTGAVERLAFAVFVGLELPGAATAMMGWLAIKLATNWNRDDMQKVGAARPFSFTALLAGLISMTFAALGGMIACGKLCSDFVANLMCPLISLRDCYFLNHDVWLAIFSAVLGTLGGLLLAIWFEWMKRPKLRITIAEPWNGNLSNNPARTV